ncbi:hypothetical protein ACFFQW_17055 [Umezawaea endophytica]|uniref:Uncharacterized protein n=1 Tax=Umezawaea endophytica TaxID=1654476 RepID=A0A9X2VQH7_9PSEU|nr:hypothetical protein [Umezawaea endophytica]MCS7480462.1 hypothetical protein [Umezawaea endophytica]
MLPRLAYLGMTNAFALRLHPMRDRDKDVEILVLRHQITILERQLGNTQLRFSPADRAFLASCSHPRVGDSSRHKTLLPTSRRPDGK